MLRATLNLSKWKLPLSCIAILGTLKTKEVQQPWPNTPFFKLSTPIFTFTVAFGVINAGITNYRQRQRLRKG